MKGSVLGANLEFHRAGTGTDRDDVGPYDFRRDGKFSHRGIDVFTLMHPGDEWEIVNLAFTMQPHVPSQHPAGRRKVKRTGQATSSTPVKPQG